MRQEITAIAIDLADGESTLTTCPWCYGGSSNDKSFSVTRGNGGILYNCYRATCSGGSQSRGFIAGRDAVQGPRKEPEFTPRHFTGTNEPLSTTSAISGAPYWGSQYGLSSFVVKAFGVGWCTEKQRFVVPVLGPNAEHKGYNLRIQKGSNERLKTIAYKERKGSWSSWHEPRPNDAPPHRRIVVVEDQWSAMRVSTFVSAEDFRYTGVALLGTHMDGDTAEEIAKVSPRVVYLSLDADATHKALEIRKKWGLMFRHCVVAPLAKDIKDMTTDEFGIYMESLGDR